MKLQFVFLAVISAVSSQESKPGRCKIFSCSGECLDDIITPTSTSEEISSLISSPTSHDFSCTLFQNPTNQNYASLRRFSKLHYASRVLPAQAVGNSGKSRSKRDLKNVDKHPGKARQFKGSKRDRENEEITKKWATEGQETERKEMGERKKLAMGLRNELKEAQSDEERKEILVKLKALGE